MVIFQLLSCLFTSLAPRAAQTHLRPWRLEEGGGDGGGLGRLASHRPCKLPRRGETAMKADEPEKSEVGGCGGGEGGKLLAAAAGAGC